MIRSLRWFLSGLILGFLGAWWLRGQHEAGQAILAAYRDAGGTWADLVRSMSQEDGNGDEETRDA